MDNTFTEKIGKWLETPAPERDWSQGALYVLQLSGNKILYNNIVANLDKRHDTIEYQLQKYYNFRVKNLTHDQVKKLDEKVEKIVSERISLSVAADENPKGKRPDHDSLPDKVKAYFTENQNIVRRMRELHLQLRKLSLANSTCPDSERYPFLTEIIKLDKKLHDNYKKYDSYIAQ